MLHDNVYNEIMNLISDNLPCNWDKVILYAEYGESSHLIEYYVKIKKEGYVKCFDLGLERMALLKMIQNIHALLQSERNATENKWSVLTMTTDSNGKLKVDYCYDDIAEVAYEHKVEWVERYLK